MVYRIIAFRTTLNAGQTNDGVGGDPAPFVITAPNGFQRTITEIRPYGDQSFLMSGTYDTDNIHPIDSDDINTYKKPHLVNALIQTPHQYIIQFTNRGTVTGNFGVDVVVDEETATAAPAAAP